MRDRVSQLPDDILVHILSLLKIREAGRSSLLSRRWKDLWKFSTHLNFYSLPEFNLSLPEKREIFNKYVTWVNEVLRLHEGTSLEEFAIDLALDASYSKDIDEWIKSVVKKRVKRLVINLGYHTKVKYYLSDPSNIECLTSLCLCYVNIGDEQLEYISKFPRLERLSVRWSNPLFNLKVAGSVVQLKYLYVSGHNLQSIELCAPKLVTFKYFGGEVKNIHIGNNPLLAELSLGWRSKDLVVDALVPFSSHLSQLETLTLHMDLKTNTEIPSIVQLKKLKHLIMKISCIREKSHTCLTGLIEAAPCLQRFTLWLSRDRPVVHGLPPYEPLNQPHQCLKEVEIFQFVGCRSDFDLIAYLLKNAVNLKRMVVKPCYPFSRSGVQVKELTTETQERVEELRKSVHPRIELIIIQ